MTSLSERWGAAPVDAGSRAVLHAGGLDYRTVDPADAEAAADYLQAVRRGFLDGESSEEETAAQLERSTYRRRTAVYDPLAPHPERPVATIASWTTELSVPGGETVPACAISAVTVAPTHRRRGIARALLEGELRVAASAGVPVAVLTVSESVLYGRYGFAPAAHSASLTLDVKRASWTGPVPPGRIDFIDRSTWRTLAPALHDRLRTGRPGEIAVPAGHWDTFAGTRPDAKDAGRLRAIQYRDAVGDVQGLALYTVTENHSDFTKSTVDLVRLDAASDDAYAALWRFFVELDLVGEVRAREQSIDEPVLWMIDDRRAATVTVQDHQYVRILDLPAALAARRYALPGAVVLEVDDPLGVTGGEWTLDVDASGAGSVSAGAHAGNRVRLGIRDLAALSLGGVPLTTLAAAGRVQAGDLPAATRLLGWHETPRLSFWY